MAEIYALYSARDGKVRYVGQTSGARDVRFKKHMRIEEGRYITAVYDWLHTEWSHGYPVECASFNGASMQSVLMLRRRGSANFLIC